VVSSNLTVGYRQSYCNNKQAYFFLAHPVILYNSDFLKSPLRFEHSTGQPPLLSRHYLLEIFMLQYLREQEPLYIKSSLHDQSINQSLSVSGNEACKYKTKM